MPSSARQIAEQETLTDRAPFTYNHVPSLRELMPSNGGLPGVIYALICIGNAKAAQDAGWGAVENSRFFTITGPRGSANMVLACKGRPIRGVSPDSGARGCHLDTDIYRITGLWVGLYPKSLQHEFNLSEHGQPLTPPEPPQQAMTIPVAVATAEPEPAPVSLLGQVADRASEATTLRPQPTSKPKVST